MKPSMLVETILESLVEAEKITMLTYTTLMDEISASLEETYQAGWVNALMHAEAGVAASLHESKLTLARMKKGARKT